MILTVDMVKFLQNALNPNALERLLSTMGVNVNLKILIEQTLKNLSLSTDSKMINFIYEYYDWFISTNPEIVSRIINNYMISNSTCVPFLNAPVCFGETISENRKILLIGGALILFLYLVF